MKTAVITGATSGIGYEVANTLLQQGWRIIGIGRSAQRCEEAKERLQALLPGADIRFITADLMQQAQVHGAAEEILDILAQKENGGLDALILNAGGVRSWYTTTAEGYEQQFALNYLSGVLLTHRLLNALMLRGGRVLWTGSGSHRHIRVRWDDIMLQKRYSCLAAYKQSKVCGMLFAQAFNRRYASGGVRMYVVDPGLVNTEIGSKSTEFPVSQFWSLRRLGGVRPEIPAQTYAYLCSRQPTPEGLYYYNCTPRRYSRYVDDAQASERLLTLSETLCGVKFREEAV